MRNTKMKNAIYTCNRKGTQSGRGSFVPTRSLTHQVKCGYATVQIFTSRSRKWNPIPSPTRTTLSPCKNFRQRAYHFRVYERKQTPPQHHSEKRSYSLDFSQLANSRGNTSKNLTLTTTSGSGRTVLPGQNANKKLSQTVFSSSATSSSFSRRRSQNVHSSSHCITPENIATHPQGSATTCADLLAKSEAGQLVSIKGWVRNVRHHSKLAFLDIFDGSSHKPLQVVIDQEANTNLSIPNFGSCVSLSGVVKASEGGKQRIEVAAQHLALLGDGNAQDNPLQPKHHSLEFLRELAHLRGRTNFFTHMFQMRNFAMMRLHDFFQKQRFIQIHTPIIGSTDCEGAGETFRIISKGDTPDSQFFDRPAFLTVSGQLQAEAFALALGRVYTFGPTFRAEKSKSSRHLAEFWMLEPEIPFFDLQQNMQLAEDMTRTVVQQTLSDAPEFVSFFTMVSDKTLRSRLESLAQHPFERISYTEAIQALQRRSKKFVVPPAFGIDLAREHEEFLTDIYFPGKAVFVHDWPAAIKPFYMRLNDDGKTCAAMDLLVPKIGELIGGSAREERLEQLQKNIDAAGINAQGDYDWYLDLRRYGSAPHAGFGLGFERFLQLLTATSNIRDTIPIPRFSGSIKF